MVSPAYVVLKSTKEIDPIFASYFFKSARMIHLFWAYSYGLTKDRLRLYFPDFELIPALLPPVAEQRRIAEILMTWDRAIDKINMLARNSNTLQQALAQEFLTGKQRVPGFTRPWKRKQLRSLGPFKKGKGLSRGHVGAEGTPCGLYCDLDT